MQFLGGGEILYVSPAMDDPARILKPESSPLDRLLAEVAACEVCRAKLPLGPRPVLRAGAGARLLIVSQAPGVRAHDSNLSFNDPSGDRLRAWLGIDRETFYDVDRVAVMPMGFCYPGTLAKGGDVAPTPECAPLWHDRVRALLPEIRLTLLVGSYALRRYLPSAKRLSTTQIVENWRSYLPEYLPLPHPSWRNSGWIKRHPWFEAELVPDLQRRVAGILGQCRR